MKPYHTPTVIAIACVVFGSALALHELTHALSAAVFGGEYLLVTSNRTTGDLRALTEVGLVLTAASGSATNWVLALTGLALLPTSRTRSSTTHFFVLLLCGGVFWGVEWAVRRLVPRWVRVGR